jgi:hypothetical protein
MLILTTGRVKRNNVVAAIEVQFYVAFSAIVLVTPPQY